VAVAASRIVNRPTEYSLVIPTYQRRDIVVRMVRALEQQVFREFEVIVVVDGSADGTAAALRSINVPFPLTLLEQENRGRAEACNAGAAAATGEYLLFLDDDMEADPRMIVEHHRSHLDGADIVLGHLPLHADSPRTVLSEGVRKWAERRRGRLTTPEADIPVNELLTGQMSVARETFARIGGFDTSFTRNGLFGGEDLDFGHRARKAGLRVVFNEAAVSHQFWLVDPAVYMRRSREAGRSAQELIAKHPDLARDLTWPEFNAWLSRLVFGTLAIAPAPLSGPLRALAARRVRSGKTDSFTSKLFFALLTTEQHRGARQARRGLRATQALVLAYQAISDLSGDRVLAQYGVPRPKFAEHLDLLRRKRWTFVTLQALLNALNGGSLPRRSVLLTFDDAYSDLLTSACPELVERGIPAVVFVVSGQIGGTNEWDRPIGARALTLLDEEGLQAVASQGIAVGAHGVTHRRLVALEPYELEAELRDSATRLVSIGLPRPAVFAYPHGVWNRNVAEAVRAAGYEAAFTVTPGVVRRGGDRYALPRIEVLASDSPRTLRLKLATSTWPDPWRRRLLRMLRAPT
jgi:peptidoglycan/xylan/chitin deacetylase (PgdA/CDA1 family)/glycosyltransferase involved in cell wall biosynthesis